MKGEVIVLPFPFSDLSQFKKRPALVVSAPTGNDLILCEITTRKPTDAWAVFLPRNDFAQGSIRQDSYVRPNKLFTIDNSRVLYKAGRISEGRLKEAIEKACEIIRN